MNSLKIVVVGVVLAAFGWSQAPTVHITEAELFSAVKSKVAAEYPPMAKQLKLQGAVVVTVTVGEDGQLESAEVSKGNPILGAAAVAAVKKWKIAPVKVGGEVRRVSANVAFSFNL